MFALSIIHLPIQFYLVFNLSIFLNKGSLKRKSDVIDISKINRTSPKTLAVNFVSSTPTLAAANIQPTTTNSKY